MTKQGHISERQPIQAAKLHQMAPGTAQKRDMKQSGRDGILPRAPAISSKVGGHVMQWTRMARVKRNTKARYGL